MFHATKYYCLKNRSQIVDAIWYRYAVCPVLLQCTVFLQTLWVLTDHLPVRKTDWKIGGLIVCSPHSAVSSFISIFPSRKALDAELWSLRLYRPHPQTELSGGLSGAKAAVQKLEKIDNSRQDIYVVTLCVYRMCSCMRATAECQ